jgi:hypothetical protein
MKRQKRPKKLTQIDDIDQHKCGYAANIQCPC